jgi:hypothetical protein
MNFIDTPNDGDYPTHAIIYSLLAVLQHASKSKDHKTLDWVAHNLGILRKFMNSHYLDPSQLKDHIVKLVQGTKPKLIHNGCNGINTYHISEHEFLAESSSQDPITTVNLFFATCSVLFKCGFKIETRDNSDSPTIDRYVNITPNRLRMNIFTIIKLPTHFQVAIPEGMDSIWYPKMADFYETNNHEFVENTLHISMKFDTGKWNWHLWNLFIEVEKSRQKSYDANFNEACELSERTPQNEKWREENERLFQKFLEDEKRLQEENERLFRKFLEEEKIDIEQQKNVVF